MATHQEEDIVKVQPGDAQRPANNTKGLNFPFRANTVARRARSPGPTELQYQLAKTSLDEAEQTSRSAPVDQDYFDHEELGHRRTSTESETSIGQPARAMMQDRIGKEQAIGEEEEAGEIARIAPDLEPVLEMPGEAVAERNTSAALREGSGEEEVIEDQMMANPSEKKRLRRENLAEKLQDVFGLAEREEVIEEMRCWLLRSISECFSFTRLLDGRHADRVVLKGYMYLTARHICFFAHMPEREVSTLVQSLNWFADDRMPLSGPDRYTRNRLVPR